jgi:Glycosyltransferases involved in cell wall biogenesis
MRKVSVIVPVYNVEKYIGKCIESILAQTLEDIEIICIDDGSTDRSGSILDTYASKDARVRVAHRTNAGYGAAMNAGIAMAEGEFIGIVESDDRIADDMYETLYNMAQLHQLDMVKSDAYYWWETADYLSNKHVNALASYYNKVLQDVDRNIFFTFFMNIWTGIYRRSFLQQKNIKFHETQGASYQDNGFWLLTCMYAERAMWIDRAFYYYRQDNPEASVKSTEKMMAMTKEYEYVEMLLKQRGEEKFLPYCYIYRLIRARGTFYRIADEYKRMFCNQLVSDYQKYKAYIKENQTTDSWFREVVKNPDEICSRVITGKNVIKQRLDNCESIIIYGAGKKGDLVFRSLYNEGYYHKIACFAVSKEPSENVLAGKQVLKIDDAVKKYSGALIIVAVIRDSGMYLQMTQKLSGLGIDEYLAGSDIEEIFYIL